MILVLFIWLVAALGTVGLGVGAYRLAARLGVGGATELPAPEWLSLAGAALLTAALQLYSLQGPIDGRSQLLFGLCTALVLVLNRRAVAAVLRCTGPWRWRAAGWLGAALLFLLLAWVLTFAAQPPTNYDAGLYQLQTLQWTERFAAVPGLGNLHGRLAFNSSFYLLLALLRAATPGGPAYALSSYLYAVLAVAAGRAVLAGQQPDARAAWAPLLLLLALLYGFQVWLSSPTTDTTTAALLGLLFCRFAQQPPGRASEAERLLLVLLTAWAVTIKLSAAPVLLLGLGAVWAGRAGQSGLRTWLPPLALAGGLALPWVARNVVLSGYLVYPLPALDVLDVDWKVPLAAARAEQHLIVNLARNAAQAAAAAPGPLLGDWLGNWWRPQVYMPGAVVLAGLISPLPALWRWRRLRRLPAAEQGWAAGWLVAWLGSVFWLVAAPDYRFGAGFLLVAALWPWLGPRWPGPLLQGRLRYFSAVLLLGWALYQLRDPLYYLRHDPARFAGRLLWPEPPPKPATEAVPLAPGLRVQVPRAGAQCWGAPLPCAPRAEAGLRPRGHTLAEGFRRAD
ncbi:LIC_10190 family membrane protein [Hymenobacter gummosus]|uniref:LIC_10190 family membrane protein n=1 Tax=Hymenobacter gummosus TaxID=1776032 RepID=UPI0014055668|nr:hypothetical protein [Hymenobacter gummosus]